MRQKRLGRLVSLVGLLALFLSLIQPLMLPPVIQAETPSNRVAPSLVFAGSP